MTDALPWRVTDGADRPYEGGLTVADVVRGARLVCHGIVPLGLRDAWRPDSSARGRAWSILAPALECAFAAGRDEPWGRDELAAAMIAAARVIAPCAVPPAIAKDLARDVLAAGVRGYGQGIDAVRDWLVPDRVRQIASTVSGYAWSPRTGDRLALQMIKEGHMSSVVVATLHRPGGRVIRFVVNVARDTRAADEQSAVARQLAMFTPADAVRVLAEGSGSVRWFGRDLPVAMLAVSFASGAEIHPLAPDPPGAAVRLMRVERFGDAPGQAVPAIRGQFLSAAAADDLWSALAAARTRAARFDADAICAPAVEVSDGDVVADERGRPTVVATEAQPWRGPAAWWPWHIVLSSARDDRGGGGRLWWNAPRRAIDSVAAALPVDAPPLLRMAAAVPEIELSQIATAHGGPAIPAGLMQRTRDLLAAG